MYLLNLVAAAVGVSDFPRVSMWCSQAEKRVSGGCGADRPGLLTFEPVADSAGGGMRPVTSGYNCSEVLGG